MLAARAAIASVVLALVALTVVHILKRDLDPSRTMISRYALGPYGWLMALCFEAWAAASALLFVALAQGPSSSLDRIGQAFLLAASIGLALPSDKLMYGYLSEHHSFGETEEVAGEYAEELAAEMLATTLNVEFDPDLSWDEKKEVYRISNKIVRTMNVTQSAVGDKRGLWTTVLGAAILIGEDD